MRIKLTILLILLFCISRIHAQSNVTSDQHKAIPIIDYKLLQQSSEWYAQQSGLWNKEIKVYSNNAPAWLNYYKSSRYSNYTTTSNKINANDQKELDNIVDNMKKNVPNSFEYNYAKYWNGNNDISLFPYLEKAYQLSPNNTELYDDMIAYYELTGNDVMKKEFCEKWYNSNDIPDQVIKYNYNVLMSLEQNAIIITNGDYDTYPLWILQNVKNTRKDICVINKNLITKDNYRINKFKEIGINDVTNSNSEANPQIWFKALCEKNPGKAIYFGLTTSPEILSSMKDKLFLTGLAYKYSNTSVDNIPILKKNWEEKFDVKYFSDLLLESSNPINANYLVPMLVLYKYYVKTIQKETAENLLTEIKIIANKSGKEKTVERFLNE
jgi:hypothetical protein